MGLNDTVSAERLHIAFFGMRNAGKSSLVNAITNQQLAVVSDVKGTTTDPVKKAMELLPLGPVVIIDTPGYDDEGELGELRVKKTREILRKTDIAVLVLEAGKQPSVQDKELSQFFEKNRIPFITVYNKADLAQDVQYTEGVVVSTVTGQGVEELKTVLANISKTLKKDKRIVADLINEGDVVVLVTPIDESAPKGRLILPQQMTIRDILDSGATSVVCQVPQLKSVLEGFKNSPKMVITDSQAFAQVSGIVPKDIPLTSFSILMARYKGELTKVIKGAAVLSTLTDSDKVLICEGCTHHRQCNDIGTVKMPQWIREHCGHNPEFHFTSGGDFPEDLTQYKVIVHCGGCMLSDTQMKYRSEQAQIQGVDMVNYGIAIAAMKGILKRSTQLFDEVKGMVR